MLNLHIDARFIRAAMACQAKKDARLYLCGIQITPSGRIAGTDGHMLYTGVAPLTASPEWVTRDTIVAIRGAIPASAKKVVLRLRDVTDPDDTAQQEIATAIMPNGDPKTILAVALNDTYPNIERVIPEPARPRYQNGVIMNTRLLAKLAKIFPAQSGMRMELGLTTEALRCTFEAPDDGDEYENTSVAVVMPMRVEQDFLPE